MDRTFAFRPRMSWRTRWACLCSVSAFLLASVISGSALTCSRARAQESSPPPVADTTNATPRSDAAPGTNPLAGDQAHVAERFKRLEELLLKSAEIEAASNPGRSALLQQAAQLGKQSQLSELLARAAKSLEQEQYSQAVEDQKVSRDNLKRLLELLQSENRQDRVREQRDQVRRWIEETDRLRRLQSSLRGRTEGGQQTDKAASDQAKLAAKAAEIARELGGDEAEDKSNAADNPDGHSDQPKSDEGKQGEEKQGAGKQGEGKQGEGKQGEQASKPSEHGKEAKDNDGKSDDASSAIEKPGSKPGESKPGESKPGESKPGESKPGESKPGDSKPGDSKPGESKPGESKPGESKPGESKFGESKPGESKPGESKSGDSKPGDSKPGESQQGQSQQGDSKSSPSQSGEGSDQKNQPPQSPTERAAQRIQRAQQRMEDAKKQLDDAQREGAVEKQREAEQELQAAIEQLEEILRQLREEEIERSLAALEDRLRLMLQAQSKVLEETQRLHEIAGGEADRQVEIRASKLSLDERKILSDGQRALLLLREEGTSAAFPEAMSQMLVDIQSVVDRLAKADTGKMTVSIEQEIVLSLEEMIEALVAVQKDQKKRKEQRQSPGGGQPGQQGEQPLVDQLAEMRLIRTLQLRVNKRTQSLSELLKDPNDVVGQADAEDIQTQLRSLAERQASIKQVTRDIVVGKTK